MDQTVTGTDGKAAKETAAKAKLDHIKEVTIKAMATQDADNKVLLQRIRDRFDKCALSPFSQSAAGRLGADGPSGMTARDTPSGAAAVAASPACGDSFL